MTRHVHDRFWITTTGDTRAAKALRAAQPGRFCRCEGALMRPKGVEPFRNKKRRATHAR